MASDNYSSSIDNKCTKLKKREIFFISLLLIVVIFFYCSVILLYYVPFYSEISEMYSTNNFVILITIIILIRISVSIYGTYFLFKLWISKNSRRFTNLPLTFGIFFFLFVPAKLMDLLVFTTYRLYTDFGFSYYLLLYIIKLRYFILTLSILPLFLSGIYLYLFRLNLRKPELKRKKLSKKLTVLFSILYFPIFFIIIIFLNEINMFSYVGALMTLSSLSFVIWVFLTAYKGKILSEINSLIISIGFICYLISNLILPILTNVIGPTSLEGERIGGLILELGTLFSMIIIIIGFKKKANYVK
ncbi:MAG: hypothetical protein HWN79_12865 [Candidatus Lokiarchaeota archaeon]|nr:hypothetical protein [Candidatus Lokiarchaeota archaeon]